MKICSRCFEMKEMYHGRNCKECRQKYLSFMQKERSRKKCPICKKEINSILTQECSTKCKILNRHKVINECWEWQGKLNSSGYGCFQENINGDKKEVRAHRESYRIFKGEIPEGMQVLHKCDNPKCCNPDHLWLGTHKDNMDDRNKKGRVFNGRERARVSGKLTEEEVIEIRKLYKNGISQKEIQEKFKISQSQVSGILTYRFWKHVEE